MNRYKRLAAGLGVLSVFSLTGSILSRAADNAAFLKNASLENGFLRLDVEQDERQGEYLKFRLGTAGGQIRNSKDDQKNLTYRNYYSGYTTLNINGTCYVYGRGTDTSEPAFDTENGCHISSQKFGDVEVQQTLTFAEGFTAGYLDMLKISYKVLSASETDTVGVRILLDPAIETDDALKITAKSVPVTNETVFKEQLPGEWKAAWNADSSVAAYGKISAQQTPAPSSLMFANWDKLYDAQWDCEPDIQTPVTDAAAALRWDPVSNPAQTEFTAFYGIRNSANVDGEGSNTAELTGPQTGEAFPVRTVLLGALTLCSAAGCVLLGRKGRKHED